MISDIQIMENREIAKMRRCVLCRSDVYLWHNGGSLRTGESCGCTRCKMECSSVKEWNNHMVDMARRDF